MVELALDDDQRHAFSGRDGEIVRGSVGNGEFTIFYLDGHRLAAAPTVGRSDDLARARELIASREPVDRDELAAV